MTIGIQSFRSTDSTREVPVRVKDDLGVDKVARGDPLVESVRTTSAEGSSGEGLRRDAQKTSQATMRE